MPLPGIYKISIYSDVIILGVDNCESILQRCTMKRKHGLSPYACCCVNTQTVCVGLVVVGDQLHPTQLIKKKGGKKENLKSERVKKTKH